jgi:hypothetical protein
MLINIWFGFMMLIASLIELPIAKTVDVAKTQDPVGEFRQGHVACYFSGQTSSIISRLC